MGDDPKISIGQLIIVLCFEKIGGEEIRDFFSLKMRGLLIFYKGKVGFSSGFMPLPLPFHPRPKRGIFL